MMSKLITKKVLFSAFGLSFLLGGMISTAAYAGSVEVTRTGPEGASLTRGRSIDDGTVTGTTTGPNGVSATTEVSRGAASRTIQGTDGGSVSVDRTWNEHSRPTPAERHDKAREARQDNLND